MPVQRNRRSWRVQALGGFCRIVRRVDLAPDEIPEAPNFLRFEIASWVRDPFFRRVLNEICDWALGGGAPFSDTASLERRITEAFRNGRLVLIREERPVAFAGGGGGSAADERSPADEQESKPAKKKSPPPEEPKKPELTWFRVRLVDEDGQPMAGEDYILVDTDGARRQGKLDDNGEAYIPPILPAGQCTIRFPNIHLNPRKKKGP